MAEADEENVPEEKTGVDDANKLQGLNENFFYNSMLARALLHIIPYKDKKTVKLWLDRLADMDQDEEELTLRHEYMWFLLLMLETRKVREPFNKIPPKNLFPLKDSVPKNVYEEILLWSDQSGTIDLEPQHKKISGTDISAKNNISPAKFLKNQPKPKDGIICYMATFSERDTY